ncbi:CRISPR-associated helicase Cas3' [Komagataeibacter sp. FNDCR1]|nr:CRISPR-associated helicase Cas3' [Komagataeibacter sp. FNDCR1]
MDILSTLNRTPSDWRYWAKCSRAELPAGELIPHHLLPFHQLDVAACFSVLSEMSVSVNEVLGGLLPVFKVMVACHDIGKYATAFQAKKLPLMEQLGKPLPSPSSNVHHTAAGFIFWRDIVCNAEGDGDRYAGLMPAAASMGYRADGGWTTLMQAAFCHHGEPVQIPNYFASEIFSDQEIRDCCRYIQAVHELFIPSGYKLPGQSSSALKRLSHSFAGLAVMADWLGSAEGHFSWVEGWAGTLEEYLTNYAIPQARRVLAETGVAPATPVGPLGLTQLFPYLAGKTPTPLQTAALNVAFSGRQNIVMVEDSPGAGKTEAALVLANRMMSAGAGEGVVLTLPTTATATSMFTRLGDVWHRLFTEGTEASCVLTHGRARPIMDRLLNNGHDVSDWLRSGGRQGLMANFGVGTVDQPLMGILAIRFQALRLAGLIGKILIIDEVHSYDIFTSSLLKNLLTQHATSGGSVICLSATMTLKLRQELVDAFFKGVEGNAAQAPRFQLDVFPAVSAWSPEIGIQEFAVAPASRKKVRLCLVHDQACLERRLLQAARQGKSVCWVRNTVEDAKEAYALLASQRPHGTVKLMHAKFTTADRAAKEQEVMDIFGPPGCPREESRPGMIVVSTQVIEQSLNCDFDVMASDLAPIDVLIQRSGRQHRHDRGERGVPEMLVLSPPTDGVVTADWYAEMFPRAAWVYRSHEHLFETARIIAEIPEWNLPEDVRGLVERVYDHDYQDTLYANFQDSQAENAGRGMAHRELSRRMSIDLPRGYAPMGYGKDLRAQTRLAEQPTVTLRLMGCGRADAEGYPTDGDVSVLQKLVDSSFTAGDDRDGFIRVQMDRSDNGTWIGLARKDTRPVIVEYSTELGVSVRKVE